METREGDCQAGDNSSGCDIVAQDVVVVSPPKKRMG